MNSWSCEVNNTIPLNAVRPLFTAVIDSRSRWFVGWSRISTFEPNSIIRDSIHLTRSPPDSTFTGLKTSSPENSIFPKNPLKYVSVRSFDLLYCESHSSIVKSQLSKNSPLSFGKYDCVVETPHLNMPSSGSVFSIRISKRAVTVFSFSHRKATAKIRIIGKNGQAAANTKFHINQIKLHLELKHQLQLLHLDLNHILFQLYIFF